MTRKPKQTAGNNVFLANVKKTFNARGYKIVADLMNAAPDRAKGEAAGRVVSANVTTVDLTPTILDVLGLEAAPGDGRSLLPLLRGAAPEAPQPVYHFVDRHPSTNQQVHVAVRRDRYKLIRRSVGWNDVQRVPPDEELYDVREEDVQFSGGRL